MDSYTEQTTLIYMKQLCDALEWLHKRKVAHLDIKPENIMIETGSPVPDIYPISHTQMQMQMQSQSQQKTKPLLKLIDFGDAVTAINRNVVLPPSNLEFSAPEMVIGQSLNTFTDCWCFGILLYVFLSGVSPFLDDSVEETTANILKCDFSFPDEYFHDISNDAMNLLRKLLVLQCSARASMTDCQASAWFTQVNKKNRIELNERNPPKKKNPLKCFSSNRNHPLNQYQRPNWKASTKDECEFQQQHFNRSVCIKINRASDDSL